MDMIGLSWMVLVVRNGDKTTQVSIQKRMVKPPCLNLAWTPALS